MWGICLLCTHCTALSNQIIVNNLSFLSEYSRIFFFKSCNWVFKMFIILTSYNLKWTVGFNLVSDYGFKVYFHKRDCIVRVAMSSEEIKSKVNIVVIDMCYIAKVSLGKWNIFQTSSTIIICDFWSRTASFQMERYSTMIF